MKIVLPYHLGVSVSHIQNEEKNCIHVATLVFKLKYLFLSMYDIIEN